MKTFLNLLLLVAITFCTLGNARVYKSLEDLYLEPASGNSVIITSPSITANQPLKFGSAKEITSGLIVLTGDVIGILPIVNGGTGTSVTAHTNLTTNVTGILPIANGGTGSVTQNFVDLTTNQAVSGTKTFNNKFSVVSTTEPSIPCPSQTSTQRDAVGSPVSGDCVYNSTTNALNIYNGSSWTAVGSGGGGGLSAWITANGYVIGDVIHTTNKIYLALTNHTSGTFATDLTNNEWIELSAFLTDAQVKTAYENNADTNALTDAALVILGNTSGTNTGDLSNAQIKTNYEANADTNALTDAALVILGNTSGTNTGDQDLSTLMTNPLTTTGDIVYATSGTTVGRLAIGTDAQVLTLASGVPTWASPAASGVGSGGSSTDNALPRWDGTAGDTLQDSSVLLSDLDALTGITSVYVSGSDASVIPFTIRGANQTANFLEVETHDGTNVLEVDSAGVLRTSLRSSTSDGFSIAPIGGATNHGIIFNGTGNNSNVTLRAANSAYMTLSGNGVLISGVGVYAIRSGTRGVSTAPAYTFDNDRDTGIFSNSANLLSMSSGAVVALTTSATEVQAKLPLELANNASATTPPTGELAIHNDTEVLKVTNDAGIKSRVSSFEPRDVLTNSSFEDSTAVNGWTCTGGTSATETTERVANGGAQSLAYTVSGATFECYQTYDCSKSPVLPQGFTVNVNSTSDVEVCGFDGTNDINCVTPASDDNFQLALAENTGGAAACGIKIKSDTSITDVIYIDEVQFTDSPYRFVDVQNTTDWIEYTPTFSGMGTPTNVEIFHRRVGGNIEVRGFFTTNAASASEAQVGLPSGLTVDTDSLSAGANLVGTVVEGASSSSFFGAYILATGGDTFLNISHQSSSTHGGTTVNASAIGSPTNIYFIATIPILGWEAASSNVVTPTKSNAKKWTTFTPSFDGGGTLGATDCKYRRVLDSMDIDCLVTTGTVGAATAALILPNSHEVDANIVAANQVDFMGHAYSISGGSSAPTPYYAFLDSDEPTKVYITSTRNGGAWEKRAANGILSSSAAYSIHLRGIPISGWNLEDTFLSMFPKDRFQTKLLSADVTTNTDISNLQFNNLVIGKVYTLNGYIVTSENVAGSNVVSLFSAAGATGTGYGAIHTNATSGTQNLGAGVSVTFKAASSTLYVNASLVTVIIGNNSPNETYLTLTENNTTIETDQF